jgi:ABC-type nitrate/sulfonate/bicarbonate transport system permease component
MAEPGSELRIVPRAGHTPLWRRVLGSHAVMAFASPLLLLLIWETAGRLGWLDQRFFPIPSSIIGELLVLLGSGELLVNLAWTVQRVAIGFCLGAVPAILLGLVMGLSPALTATLRPVIAVIYPIPKVALFPLIMLMFGLGETSKWVIVAIAVFFQVFFSTLAGVANIERIYLDVARNFGASRWQAYRLIAMPAALPFIFTGCQLGIGMALIVVVVAEQFGTKTGLGYMIWRSWQVFEVRDMFVGLMMVALLGYGIQLAMGALEGRVIRWKPHANTKSLL